MKKDLTKKNYLWCYISLLKASRANHLIEYTKDQQAYKFKEEVGGIKTDLAINVSFIKVATFQLLYLSINIENATQWKQKYNAFNP